MTTKSGAYDQKLQLLTNRVQEVERHAAALRQLIRPGFDVAKFHSVYDPLMKAAQEAHDVYHELLHASGHAH